MRGKGSKQIQALEKQRITPAYAGKSGDAEERYFAIGDHPRLCGEKSPIPLKTFLIAGSPPPMRGKVL